VVEVVVVAMIFVVPVAFVHLPALLVVVIVGMAPVGSLERRTLPNARTPDVAASVVSPIAVYPHVALAGHYGTPLIPQRRWSAANVDVYLCDGWCSKRRECDSAGEQS
jgi:hypothetical protein